MNTGLSDHPASQGGSGPLISVIVPVYQVKPYLAASLDSILAQTWQHLQILLVDDGSTDGSGELCDAYAEKDSRFTVIHQKNGGVSAARNTGVSHAAGELIAFVDPDDIAAPEMLQTLYDALSGADAQIAICGIAPRFAPDVKPYGFHSIIRDEVIDGKEGIRRLTEPEYWQYVSLCTKLIRRELFDGIVFPVGYIHEDTFVTHHLFGKCSRIACVSTQLYTYCVRSTGITRGSITVRRADDVYAFADRIVYVHTHGMDGLLDDLIHEYVMRFWEVYSIMTFDDRDLVYRRHAMEGLKRVFRLVMRNRYVPWGEKVRLAAYRISPGLYHRFHETGLRRIVEKIR